MLLVLDGDQGGQHDGCVPRPVWLVRLTHPGVQEEEHNVKVAVGDGVVESRVTL